MIVINSLKPGARLCDVYEKGLKYIKEKAPEIVENLITHFGFGIGLEFKENLYVINSKNERFVS